MTFVNRINHTSPFVDHENSEMWAKEPVCQQQLITEAINKAINSTPSGRPIDMRGKWLEIRFSLDGLHVEVGVSRVIHLEGEED